MAKRGYQLTYLGLALLGAGSTWYYNVRFMLASGGGFGLADFIKGGFANYAAASLSVDVFVAAVVFLVWMFVETRRLGMRRWWIYAVLTCGIALAFAFPFFLYMREKHLSKTGC